MLASGVLISVGLGTAYVLRRRKEKKPTLTKDKEPVIHEDEENIGDIPESSDSHSPEAKKPEQTTPKTGIFGKVFKSQAEKARDAEQDKQNALREAQEKINAENARKRNS